MTDTIHFDDLPEDIFDHITKYMDTKSLRNTILSVKRYDDFIKDNYISKNIKLNSTNIINIGYYIEIEDFFNRFTNGEFRLLKLLPLTIKLGNIILTKYQDRYLDDELYIYPNYTILSIIKLVNVEIITINIDDHIFDMLLNNDIPISDCIELTLTKYDNNVITVEQQDKIYKLPIFSKLKSCTIDCNVNIFDLTNIHNVDKLELMYSTISNLPIINNIKNIQLYGCKITDDNPQTFHFMYNCEYVSISIFNVDKDLFPVFNNLKYINLYRVNIYNQSLRNITCADHIYLSCMLLNKESFDVGTKLNTLTLSCCNMSEFHKDEDIDIYYLYNISYIKHLILSSNFNVKLPKNIVIDKLTLNIYNKIQSSLWKTYMDEFASINVIEWCYSEFISEVPKNTISEDKILMLKYNYEQTIISPDHVIYNYIKIE